MYTDHLIQLDKSAPTSVAGALNGDIFVLNSGPDSVIRYDAQGVQTAGMAALLPTGSKSSAMVYDPFGLLNVANPGTHSVSRIDATTMAVTPFALPTADIPVSLALSPTRDLFVTKTNDEIAKISVTGTVTLAFGKLAAGADPHGIVVDSAGNVFTANTGDGTVSKVTPGGVVTEAYASLGRVEPTGIAIDGKGMMYVADTALDAITKLDSSMPAGTPPVAVYPLPAGSAPSSVVVDEFGNVFVSEPGLKSVGVLVPGDNTVYTAISGLSATPGPLALSKDNRLLIPNKAADSVSAVNLETRIQTSTLSPMTVGTPFSGNVGATGIAVITYSSPDLPAWLKLDPKTGSLTGTPTVDGSFSFTLRAMSNTGRSDARTVRFDVAAAMATPTPTAAPGTQAPGTQTPGSGSGSGAAGGSHGAASLAHTGAADTIPVGMTGAIVLLVGAMALLVTRVRRARRSA